MSTAQSLPNAKSTPFARLPILFESLQLPKLPHDTQHAINQINALLPQTQCGLCGYKDGCLPYAHAIVTNNEKTNLCVPGGNATSLAISELTGTPYAPAMPSKWEIDPATDRPIGVLAVIDERACIGCTKCIPACPVDAIIGTAKHTHSIIDSLCTGCELCVAPCPVDCIDIIPAKENTLAPAKTLQSLYHAHLNRLTERLAKGDTAPVASHTESKIINTLLANESITIDETTAKNTILLAKLRTQIKKLEKQVATAPQKQGELDRLIAELNALTQS